MNAKSVLLSVLGHVCLILTMVSCAGTTIVSSNPANLTQLDDSGSLPLVMANPPAGANDSVGPHQVSAADTEVTGAAFQWASAQGVTADGTIVTIDATAGLAWAIYQWSGLDGMHSPVNLVCAAVPQAGQRYWIGLSDYSQGVWNWTGPWESAYPVISYPGSGFVSDGGNTSVAVVAETGNALRLDNISLGTGIAVAGSHLQATFLLTGGPGDLPAGTTETVNGVSLTIEEGSAVYDSGSGELSFNVRLNNVGGHSVSGLGFGGIDDRMRDTEVFFPSTTNGMTRLTIGGWPFMVDPGAGTGYAPWVFSLPVMTPFHIFVRVEWAAGHDFVAFEAKNAQNVHKIYYASPDLSDPVELDIGADAGCQPAWSPDRTLIAFSNGYDIMIVNSDEQVFRITTNGYPDYKYTNPAWSPDGRQLVFSGVPAADTYTINLFKCNVDGSGLVQLTDDPQLTDINEARKNRYPCWTPDGLQIICERQHGRWAHETDFFTMNPNGSNLIALTDTDDDVACYMPMISPDGTQIVYAGDEHWKDPYAHDRVSIYVMDIAATETTRLTDPGEFEEDWNPHWAPDGSSILFVRGDDTRQLWSMQPDGSDVQMVNFGAIYDLAW